MQPSQQSPIVLMVPAMGNDPRVATVAQDLQRAGWNVALTNDVAAYLPYARACIVVLSSATGYDPAVAAVLAARPPILIPLLADDVALPYATWTAQPIPLGNGQNVAASIMPLLTGAAYGGAAPSAPYAAPNPSAPAYGAPVAPSAPYAAPGYAPSQPYQPSAPYQPMASAPYQPTPSAPYQPGYPPSSPYPAAYPPAPPAQGNNTGRVLLIVGVAVVVLAAIVGAALVLGRSNGGASNANVAGTWGMTINLSGAGGVSGSSGGNTLVLQQNGSTLNGTLTDNTGKSVAVTGTVSGQSITLNADLSISSDGITGTATYRFNGTVSSDDKNMSGNLAINVSATSGVTTTLNYTGTWTATRE